MRTLLIMAFVVIPVTLIGAFCGHSWSLRAPLQKRSTATMMLESRGDNNQSYTLAVVDSMLKSDTLQTRVFDDPRFASFRDKFDGEAGFAAISRSSITTDAKTEPDAKPLVFQISFDSDDTELNQAALQSYCYALQNYIVEHRGDSGSDLSKLISDALEKLQPKITELENRYRDFRRDAPLTFDSGGNAINPHRERQLFLVQRRSELYEELRQKQIKQNQVQQLAEKAKQPSVALNVIGQLLGIEISIDKASPKDTQDQDTDLESIEVDEELVPLMIERNKYAAQFGENHPTVKELDTELTLMKRELKRIVKEQADRALKLRKENKQDGTNADAAAAEAVASVVYALKAETALLSTQIAQVDSQIEAEKVAATKMAKYEQENNSMLREMERNRQLMNQLEEQMGRVSIAATQNPINLVLLSKPSPAEPSQPGSQRLAGIGAGIGFAFALLLSLAIVVTRTTNRTATA